MQWSIKMRLVRRNHPSQDTLALLYKLIPDAATSQVFDSCMCLGWKTPPLVTGNYTFLTCLVRCRAGLRFLLLRIQGGGSRCSLRFRLSELSSRLVCVPPATTCTHFKTNTSAFDLRRCRVGGGRTGWADVYMYLCTIFPISIRCQQSNVIFLVNCCSNTLIIYFSSCFSCSERVECDEIWSVWYVCEEDQIDTCNWMLVV